jgi:hypothetical protein
LYLSGTNPLLLLSLTNSLSTFPSHVTLQPHNTPKTFNMSPIALEEQNHTRDAEFNKAMHGKSSQARGGMASMLQKDRGAQKAAVDEYFKHWDNKSAEDETDETRKVRH